MQGVNKGHVAPLDPRNGHIKILWHISCLPSRLFACIGIGNKVCRTKLIAGLRPVKQDPR